MKMSKKVREYKSGDFIFAKVKGYPAWPARVQRLNGKKYFVYFYGTGETANLPPNMIFDYAENKDKFLTKTVKRRDFNDGVKQIEHDFANNVPLEDVVGLAGAEQPTEGANNTMNDTANETIDESAAETTAADETITEESTTQNNTAIEDSDETGALVIDEGKAPEKNQKGRKSTAKTPAKETPKAKEPKTPRGKAKKDDAEEMSVDDKRDEEIVSRSGRKIRPKRYIDEHTEENSTLPSPAPKKRRGASPTTDSKEKDKTESPKDKEKEKEKDKPEKHVIKHFNAVTQAELEDLKESFVPDDPNKENIIIVYLPSDQYVGIKLFQSRPNSFKNDNARLQWEKQAAANALTLKMQLEKGQITTQSVLAQLVMDLNLTEEEKALLDKERDTEEKKSRVHFLKTEMKLIELDAKIKTCLCLEKADTEMCLKLLDELKDMQIKPLMLLKHPSCIETVKRMRAYVGNTPSWDLSERDVLQFGQHAHRIRKQADLLYNNMKDLFSTPVGLSFWEFFMERVNQFQKVTANYKPEELLELIHEPLEMSVPTSHTMTASVEAANEADQEAGNGKKPKSTPAKSKKTATPKASLKRQSSRKQEEKDKEKEKEKNATEESETNKEVDSEPTNTDKDNTTETTDSTETDKDTKENDKGDDKDTEEHTDAQENKTENAIDKENSNENEKNTEDNNENESEKLDTEETPTENTDAKEDAAQNDKEDAKNSKELAKNSKEEAKNNKEVAKSSKEEKKNNKDDKKSTKEKEDKAKNGKEEKDKSKEDKTDKRDDKEKTEDEPRAKRTRESKKTDPPPRSPAKRKSKA